MNTYQVLEIKKSIYKENDGQALLIRQELEKKEVFLINIMSSPGSGKTTTLVSTIEALKGRVEIGVMEADIDSDVDAKSIAETGTKVIQLHSGGMCHLDASMTSQGLNALGVDDVDLVFLENIGNLICTASYDVGANKNVLILSVPEGDDKPLKYPRMFEVVDVVLVNKMDALSVFDFDLSVFKERVLKLNPSATIIPISAKTKDGIQDWVEWVEKEMKKSNAGE